MTLAPDDRRHGTNNGYTNFGCRCDPCREARRLYDKARDFASYHREWRHRTGRNKPRAVYLAEVEPEHGTESRYVSRRFRCRCDLCTAAQAEARRQRRHATRVPCSHGCGELVDTQGRRNPDKPPECGPCAMRRVHAERRAARATA